MLATVTRGSGAVVVTSRNIVHSAADTSGE